MKILAFHRQEDSLDRVKVECADGMVEVHSHCAYCRYCAGVRVRKRTVPNPLLESAQRLSRGQGADEDLMNALMMFNTLVRDGEAIQCEDDEGAGFRSLYR